jgi:hypothetical protein
MQLKITQEYVVFFPLQQWLGQRATMLRYNTLSICDFFILSVLHIHEHFHIPELKFSCCRVETVGIIFLSEAASLLKITLVLYTKSSLSQRYVKE